MRATGGSFGSTTQGKETIPVRPRSSVAVITTSNVPSASMTPDTRPETELITTPGGSPEAVKVMA